MEKLEESMNTQGKQAPDANIAAQNSGADSRQTSGQSYGYNDQELIRQLVKSRMEQKQSLEYEDLDGYEMPPRSQFSMLKKPAVSIKYGKLSFNMACIRLFEGVQYILPLCHPQKKRLTVVMCSEEESASVDWARIRQKDGEWVNKDISSPEYVDKIYKMMGWNRECRYKVLGRVANSREGLVLVFELEEAVMYESKSATYVDEKTGETKEKKRQVSYYPEFYKDRIGKSYNDYVAARQINMFEYLEEYVGNSYSDYSGSEEKESQKIDTKEHETDSAEDHADHQQEYSAEMLSEGHAANSVETQASGRLQAEETRPALEVEKENSPGDNQGNITYPESGSYRQVTLTDNITGGEETETDRPQALPIRGGW